MGINILMQMEEEILQYITSKILDRYKIDEKNAFTIAQDCLFKHPNQLQLIDSSLPVEKLKKNKILKEIITNSRSKAYYYLRTYKSNKEKLDTLIQSLNQATNKSEIDEIVNKIVINHISTKERFNENQEFYNQVQKSITDSKKIMDVGCGMNPLLFPYFSLDKITKYLAFDKDKQCVEAIHAYSEIKKIKFLTAFNHNLDAGWEFLGEEYFDAAFMMKLVSVVKRSNNTAYQNLLQTPAKKWVITGSKTSMTKYDSIQRRELRIIKRFVEEAGKKIIDQFSLEEEFCIIVE